jgi:flagellar hook assembly protein FlgD
MQVLLYVKNPITLETTDIIYSRAKMMTADVKSVGKEVSIILWNSTNTPIEPGDSTIFSLPVQLTDANIDSMKVMVSTGVNNDVLMIGSKQTDIRNMIPRDWVLYQNYPNPFNPSTTIEFDVPEVANKIPRVAVQIFNILGQKVTTLKRDIPDAGRYSIRWDGMSENGVRVASGVYFYRLLAGDYTSTKKMVMMK